MSAQPQLFDTLSQRVLPIQPQQPGKPVSMYCCGPTVYGPAHIGNFRTFVLQDVLRRVIETAGLEVRHVRNITDVDDKTIRQSQVEHLSLESFTHKWEQTFEEDCARLNLLVPHVSPSAVQHIPEQIAMIETLVAKGFAYVAPDGSVYYRVGAFKDYGKLSHIDPQTLRSQSTNSAGGLNTADEYTRDHVADFALWKAYKPEDGPNRWDSPWGSGRPGWHIECSAMSCKHLGETIDIHGGGIDLIFPHHENEIAQTEAITGKHFAKHWFHCAHLKVEGQKMSKSLGNLYTLDDLVAQGHSVAAVRYLLLSGFYRQPLNFTMDGLHAAQKALDRLGKWIREAITQAEQTPADWTSYVQPRQPSEGSLWMGVFEALCADLNTPEALGHLFKILHATDPQLLSKDQAQGVLQQMGGIVYALGLEIKLELPQDAAFVPQAVQDWAHARWNAKVEKDFARADSLRQQ
ncbi:MAG: cysteine--tRNA ligase, partial [Verrucomicrobia bacterium 21-51-4]